MKNKHKFVLMNYYYYYSHYKYDEILLDATSVVKKYLILKIYK